VNAGVFSDLRAVYINCTLKRSPEPSHTQGLADRSIAIMEENGVEVETVRAVDQAIATGVWPDMTEHGWDRDDWPEIFEEVIAADILVLTSPIWLGQKSSVCMQVIERLYGNSHLLNDAGQYAYYGRVGGCLITGNEDGIKHCAMEIPLLARAPRVHRAASGRRGLDRRGRTRPELPGRGLGWPRQRLHQPQHDLHDLEPAPPRAHAQGRRRDPGTREPANRVGRGLSLRLPQPRSTAEEKIEANGRLDSGGPPKDRRRRDGADR
jgi:multimeric flavodoxin WrbA